MNANHRPTAQELAELSYYLSAREHGEQLAPGQPGFPSGFAGELLKLAQATRPDPAFAERLEQQLRQASPGKQAAQPGWLAALWQSFTITERKTAMKRLIPIAISAILLIVVLWVAFPYLFPSPTATQVALNTPATPTQAITTPSPLTPTAIAPTPRSPLAALFTPAPIPNQPPKLPSLVEALGTGYGGSGAGNLPGGLPVSLAAELPEGPSDAIAYYRLENAPLTLTNAQQLASQWDLSAQYYMPGWMQSVTPAQFERSYIAVDGMQELTMWNGELSYTDLSIFPLYAGHQVPQAGLPSAEQAVAIATDYLTRRGFLDFPYRVDLSQYGYGLVYFYRLMDGLAIDNLAGWVKISPQGLVGSAWISREEYQAVGTYPLISARHAWDVLSIGGPGSQLSISYYPAGDGNPQYWGRVYPVGKRADLFGAPTYLLSVATDGSPYILLNNLLLQGDVSGLLEYLRGNQGYIHAWGEVEEVNTTRVLQLSGWEPFDEFSGYFNGTIRRTAEGNFLELEDGTMLSLPDLPVDVPADLSVYAQGGRVNNTLEWFILQVHSADEGQAPPDLSQAQAVVDSVELIYLAPGFSAMTPTVAQDASYRMLVPVWRFTGHITGVGAQDLIYRAYVQAVPNP